MTDYEIIQMTKNKSDRELFDFVIEEGGDRFWELCRERLQPEIEKHDASKMSDDEVRRFGRQKMKFGKHINQRIDDVPRDYLEWLADQYVIYRDLNRYLKSTTL